MIDADNLIDDLAVFADLGTNAPIAVKEDRRTIVRLIREGQTVDITILDSGQIIERCGEATRQHASFRALLASPLFANLARWAESQRSLLLPRVERESIRVLGRASESGQQGDIILFDDSLIENAKGRRVSVTVLDGPAGIGKTSFIRALAARRAEQFRSTQRPLILHVESRGRVLQNITDLMAFSLQTLRLSVTYDQIPALVKHGLIVLAIDGFDELGDPNGYELAWAQVNDLISSVRGQGNLILSGRDTFLGHDRMKGALTSVDPNFDDLSTFSLLPLSAIEAKNWLRSQGWNDEQLEAEETEPLFEDGSYALRAFFLTELARENVADRIVKGQIQDLLSFLIDAMVARESTKFGRDVESVTTDNQRELFVRRLMEEVARDLAENQTSSIPSDTLAWLAEAVSDEMIPSALSGILKNRAGVIAFLTDDERRGYKSFIHEKVFDHFLSNVAFESVCEKQAPKFVRRNIFGRDFLETFADIVRTKSDNDIERFFTGVSSNLENLGFQDRGRGNIGALALAACSVAIPNHPLVLSDMSLDEAYVTETISPVKLINVSIGQIDARSADLRGLEFGKSCNVFSLIGDIGTIPGKTFPLPIVIEFNGESINDPDQKSKWMMNQYSIAHPPSSFQIDKIISKLVLYELLLRIIRYRPFWLKDGDERPARRILDDPNWETLKNILLKHELIVERFDVPASGRPAPFYHLKDKESLMNLKNPPEKVADFLSDLIYESVKIQEGKIEMP